MKLKKKLSSLMIFTPTLAGGLGLFIVNIANGLAAKNYKIAVLAVKKSSYDYHLNNQNINLIYLQSKRVLTSIFGFISCIRREKPDIVLSACCHANIVAILSKLFLLSNYKVVCTEHAALTQSLRKVFLFKRLIIIFLIKVFYRIADAIVAVSMDVKKDIVKISGISEKRINIIYNPIIFSSFYEMANERIVHPWFKNEKNYPPIILGVGRLEKEKGFEILINAFWEARLKRDLRLMIIGEGAERKNLEKLIRKCPFKKDIALLGFLKNPYPYFKKADVFVLSSFFEGLPTVLVEALALGVPIIASNCLGGVSEILENGKWGLLVPVGDKKKLAEGIIYTLNSKNKLQKIKEKDLIKYKLEYAVAEYIKVLTVLN